MTSNETYSLPHEPKRGIVWWVHPLFDEVATLDLGPTLDSPYSLKHSSSSNLTFKHAILNVPCMNHAIYGVVHHHLELMSSLKIYHSPLLNLTKVLFLSIFMKSLTMGNPLAMSPTHHLTYFLFLMPICCNLALKCHLDAPLAE